MNPVSISVTLDDMLCARENRAETINALLSKYKMPVACLTMNMAGDIKTTVLSRKAFLCVVEMIQASIPIFYKSVQLKFTGDEAFFVTNTNPLKLKQKMCAIEETPHIGRLLDIDVFKSSGEKLSRETQRKCLICDNPAFECARSRAHELKIIGARTSYNLRMFFADMISSAAHYSLLAEVDATPKPGLVDRLNTGAHNDMDINTFYRSANALRGRFTEIAYTSMLYSQKPHDSLMSTLRELGLMAERDMMTATKGINTHRGSIFAIGLLTASYAILLERDECPTTKAILNTAASLAASHKPLNNSNGSQARRAYSVNGASGEAKSGFITVAYAKTRLDHYMDECCHNPNQAAIFTLLDIMSILDDTNVLHRAGAEGLRWLKHRSKQVAKLPASERIRQAVQLDKELISRNISPGGSADILAAALFLRALSCSCLTSVSC